MGRGARGRRRGRRKSRAARSSRSKASSSSSKSSKSKSKRRSTAASKRRKVRSVAKAARAAKRAAKASASTSSSTSSSSKNKTKRKVRKLKLNKRDRQKLAGENVKKAFKKKQEQKKKTISASQSRRQVRQKTKEKIATRKKINLPSLSQVGRFTRNLRQPVTALSKMAINSVMGNPAFASNMKTNIASALANSKFASDYNKPQTPDRSKMTPQQIRRLERMSQKTGVDYFSPRKVVGKINLSADTLAGIGKFRNAGWYTGLTNRFPGIKKWRVNKTLYGRDKVKGWHSSQRPGRGHGVREGYKGQPIGDDVLSGGMVPGSWLDFYDKQIQNKGPEPDWLGDVYRAHNIAGGNLDEEARNYWSSEAKTKGRDAVIKSIIGTSKAQGTYGGRSKNKPMKKQSTSQSAINRYKQTRARRIPTSMLKALNIRGGM